MEPVSVLWEVVSCSLRYVLLLVMGRGGAGRWYWRSRRMLRDRSGTLLGQEGKAGPGRPGA